MKIAISAVPMIALAAGIPAYAGDAAEWTETRGHLVAARSHPGIGETPRGETAVTDRSIETGSMHAQTNALPRSAWSADATQSASSAEPLTVLRSAEDGKPQSLPASTDVWQPASMSEATARAMATAESGAAANGGAADAADAAAQRLALSALAEHAARVMGVENARRIGLDTLAPPIDPGPQNPAVGGAAIARQTTPPAPASSAKTPGAARGRQAGRLADSPYDHLIERVALEHNVAPNVVRAVIKVESSFQPKARSPKGAVGLMQVMPATGKRFGAHDLEDPHTNISAGTRYLRWLLNRFDEDLTLALAAYNAGEGAVEKHGRKVPPYPETRDYVTKVMGHLAEAYDKAAAPGPVARSGAPSVKAETAPAAAAGSYGRATLRTVATWLEAVLTSAYRHGDGRSVAEASAAQLDSAWHGSPVSRAK